MPQEISRNVDSGHISDDNSGDGKRMLKRVTDWPYACLMGKRVNII